MSTSDEVTRPDSMAPLVPQSPLPEMSAVHERQAGVLPGDLPTLLLIAKQMEAVPVILEECKAIRQDYTVTKKIIGELFDEVHRYRHEIEMRVTNVERRVTKIEFALEELQEELRGDEPNEER